MNTFTRYVSRLHRDKDAAYGDSWKKRGERYSILPNIARKVDRLGVSDDHETAADTAIDLLVYLLKYRLWLSTERQVRPPAGLIAVFSEGPTEVDTMLRALARRYSEADVLSDWLDDSDLLTQRLKTMFEDLLLLAEEGTEHYLVSHVEVMYRNSFILAQRLWVTTATPRFNNDTRRWNPES